LTAVARYETCSPVTPAQADASTSSNAATLLPDPRAFAGGAVSDPMTCIYAALSQLREASLQSGRQRVAENQSREDAALADEIAASKRQEANEAGSGRGFFSSIGHLVTDVAGDLAHGDIGQAVRSTESDVTDAWDSPKFWGDVFKGLKVVADVAGVLSALPVVGEAAAVVGEVAAVGVGVASVRGGYFAAEVVNARADGVGAAHDVDSLHTVAGWLIDDLKGIEEAYGRALDDARGAIRTRDQTLLGAASIAMKG
jgi:hypothetical protein